jgi:anti-sigma regulatory factor (Ser/Thr protein kinase)
MSSASEVDEGHVAPDRTTGAGACGALPCADAMTSIAMGAPVRSVAPMADRTEAPDAAIAGPPGPYRHEVFLYRGIDEYVSVLSQFVLEGVAAGEPVLVAVPCAGLAALRTALPDLDGRVEFVDMVEIGDNPARIISAWSDFLTAAGGRPSRGVGEPVYPGRDAAQLDECHRHEHLLNGAFTGHRFRLLCPYDMDALDTAELDAARSIHAVTHEGGAAWGNPAFSAGPPAVDVFAGPLPPAPPGAAHTGFDAGDIPRLRSFVDGEARRSGLDPDTAGDLVLAADEIATNFLVHGGSGGTVRCWVDGAWFVCELDGPGTIADPLAGRLRPAPESTGGRGLWMANHLCDLVQIRNRGDGCVVRLRSRIARG